MVFQPGFYPSPTTQMAQQRLQAMEAQYPQFANPMPMPYQQGQMYPNSQPQPSPNSIIKGRLVSNEEEANAAMIDFDGSLFVFLDKAHNRIYTKQLGLDGNIIFNVYAQEGPRAVNNEQSMAAQEPHSPINLSGYAKMEDIEKALTPLQEKIARLEQKTGISQNKGGNKP